MTTPTGYVSDSSLSDSVATAYDIDEFYYRIANLEKATYARTDEIDTLKQHIADTALITRRLGHDHSILLANFTTNKLEYTNWIKDQTVITHKMTKGIWALIAISSVHGIWCLGTIAKKILKERR